MTSFASEEIKGFYISIVWSIYMSGAVVGASIPVGQNWNNNGTGVVTNGTYIGLMILMLLGAFLGLCLYPWQKMAREDGSRVTLERQKTLREELVASYFVYRRNLWIMWFWPMCWAVNYYTVSAYIHQLRYITKLTTTRSIKPITTTPWSFRSADAL